ncbi:hypothetical protein BDV59DRAFT_170945 [Aspergillus ambiguus]|uniref:uncharacterized protein n=1 Tax=Aspergillus ambiguus TaxID=176160 RepID=UPI003CCD2445
MHQIECTYNTFLFYNRMLSYCITGRFTLISVSSTLLCTFISSRLCNSTWLGLIIADFEQ